MDIIAEKKAIIKRFNQVHDEALLKAIKGLLDFGLKRQSDDRAMEASINRGLAQSKKRNTQPHEEVMAEVKKKLSMIL